MRHADWSGLPSSPAAWGTNGIAAPQAPALPAAPSMSGQAYTPLGQDVARDVQQFIAQGSSTPLGAASPQAQWLAMQAARQLQGVKKTDSPREGASAVEASDDVALPPASLKPEQQAFLQRIGPWAQQAAQRLGVSVRSVMAHAALESGWGQRPLRDAQGNDTLNFFGIKAAGGWQGASVQAATTEYEDGEAVSQLQPFRQYKDMAAGFADYARLLGNSPRYRAALNTGDDVRAFASALAQGGYATDPQYARKLLQVSRSIPSAP